MEIRGEPFLHRLGTALYRPFLLTLEPIVLLVTLYLTVIYIVLFTFLDGYDYIFGSTYGISQGLTGLCFLNIAIGLFGASLWVPLIYKWAKRDMAAIRRLYAGSVHAAETLWESADVEGAPDLPAALRTVDGLADAVTQNRTAIVALTAMRNYDNYTFTHMVNVSILTMGQARTLGIEGRLLREFACGFDDLGAAAVVHAVVDGDDVVADGHLLGDVELLDDAAPHAGT